MAPGVGLPSVLSVAGSGPFDSSIIAALATGAFGLLSVVAGAIISRRGEAARLVKAREAQRQDDEKEAKEELDAGMIQRDIARENAADARLTLFISQINMDNDRLRRENMEKDQAIEKLRESLRLASERDLQVQDELRRAKDGLLSMQEQLNGLRASTRAVQEGKGRVDISLTHAVETVDKKIAENVVTPEGEKQK